VLQRAYIENAQYNPVIPKADGIVPLLLKRVMPVHEAVYVEYFLPGCPPPAERIKALMVQVLNGETPKLEGANLKFG
jgi:NAD-reducing hydrogenase small subunit